MQKVFAFFLSPRPDFQILTPHACPTPLKHFPLDALNNEQNLSVKKTGRPGRSETGQPAYILKFTGRENPDQFHFW